MERNQIDFMECNQTTVGRVRGLDSIRFVGALWVFFGHGAAPPLLNPFADHSTAALLLRGLYGNIWSGPAAVIVFFVISGFCIHFPFAASARRPQIKEFYARRFLRILLPVICAVPLSRLVGVRLSLFNADILWSLLAELIYYACYPILRAGQLRFGSWRGMVALSFVAAFVVAATDRSAGNYPSYGPALNWILGLPCWLLGCVLAESVRAASASEVSAASIWAWRAVVLVGAWSCSALRFHSPIGYPWTLNLFAALVVLWLRREICFRLHASPSRFLEWAGSWSYSLYLIHVPARVLFGALFPASRNDFVWWALMAVFVLATCYVFHLVIEAPSHAIAQKAANRLRAYQRVSIAAAGA